MVCTVDLHLPWRDPAPGASAQLQMRRPKRAYYPAHPHITDIWLALEHAFHFEVATHNVIEGEVRQCCRLDLSARFYVFYVCVLTTSFSMPRS